VWTSLIVIVSFIWGAFIFQEPFHSLPLACGGACLIVTGAIGMTLFGIKKEDEHASEPSLSSFTKPWEGLFTAAERPKTDGYTGNNVREEVPEDQLSSLPAATATTTSRVPRKQASIDAVPPLAPRESLESLSTDASTDDDDKERFVALLGSVTEDHEAEAGAREQGAGEQGEERAIMHRLADRGRWQGRGDVFVELCGYKMRRQSYGILAAVFNGCYGGSVMAPLKFAEGSASGISFVISFGIGVFGITSLMWLGWWVALKLGLVQEELPSLQLSVMWLPGSISGVLWAVGNFCSIYAVIYLGQAAGYSACQANIAISGAWGIFYYQEQISTRRIALWFVAAFTTIGGIVLLTLAK